MTPRMLLAILSRLRALQRRERWEGARLQVYQAAALRRTRAHAYARSPFYRRFHHGLSDAPLTALPVLTKAMLRARPCGYIPWSFTG